MPLTVEEYNKCEKEASSGKPNRILEAFYPVHFGTTSYPLSISSDSEMLRYVDVMHELRHVFDYNEILDGFTAEEFDLFKEVTKAVAGFSEKRFGKRMVPRGALVRAMIAYRHIRFLSSPHDTTVFELGPGSGYLGTLLALSGFRYGAMDITQPFYLYQSNLWEYMFGERLIELATSERNLDDFEEFPDGAVLHVPWWKYAQVDPGNINLKVDVVTSNHAICEMGREARHYSANLCGRWLSELGRDRYFYAEGMGSEATSCRMEGYKAFLERGYLHVYRDTLMDIFSPVVHNPPEKEEPPESGSKDQPPLPNPAGPSAIHKLLWMMRPRVASRIIRRSIEALMRPGGTSVFSQKVKEFFVDADLTKGPPLEYWLGPLELGMTLDNDFFKGIKEGRKAVQQAERVPHEDVVAFQKEVLGSDDLLNDDERFYQFCFGKDYYG